ncbi:hypothetical protein MD484_g8564, partial [Candolleomyces efflorescens]
MPRIASARHRTRLVSAVRHLKVKPTPKSGGASNGAFAQTVPRFLQMPDPYRQDSDAMSTSTVTVVDQEEFTMPPSIVHLPDAPSNMFNFREVSSTPSSMVDYRDVTPTPSSMVDDRELTPTASAMVDDRELTPTASAMNIDGPQSFPLHRLIQLPGFSLSSQVISGPYGLPDSIAIGRDEYPQGIAGPSRFPGCLDWDDQSSVRNSSNRQKDPSIAYVMTPAGYESLCSAVQRLQEATQVVHAALNGAEMYYL